MYSPISAPRIYLRTLGRFELAVDGRVIRLRTLKDKALVSFLALNSGRNFSRDYLAELLWSKSAASRSRHSLNQSLYAIRRIMPELLVHDNAIVTCPANKLKTDVHELRKISDLSCVNGSLSLIRGGFLEDVSILESNDFEEWKSETSRSLFCYLDILLGKMLDTLPQADRRPWVLNNLSHLVDLCPTVKATLDNPLGVKDCNRSPNCRPASLGSIERGELPLIGRKEQRHFISEIWRECKRGQSDFVLVCGPAGLGKTTIVESFLATSPGDRILRVKCYEAEKRVGLAPVVDLLVRNLTHSDLQGLDGVWIDSLARIAPTLQVESARTPPALSDSAAQTRLFEAVLRALIHVSSVHPTIVFIDDVQWADRSTKALLSYVSHRLRAVPIMLVACIRTKTGSSVIPRPWSEWKRIAVRPFTDNELEELMSVVSLKHPTRPLPSAAAIKQLTGGIPYYATEAIRACLRGQDISSWRKTKFVKNANQFLIRTVRSMQPESQRVLSYLAILGRPISAEELRKITRAQSITAPIAEIQRAGLILMSKRKVTLSHDLVREAVYNLIPLFSRTEIHRQIADSLRKTRAGEAAEHYYQAGLRARAHRYALHAVEEADARYANEASIAFLQLAIRSRRGDAFKSRWALAQRLFRAGHFGPAKVEAQQLLSMTSAAPRAEYASILVFDLIISYELSELTGAALRDKIANARNHIQRSDLITLIRLLRLGARAAYHDGNLKDVPVAVDELRSVGMNTTAEEGLAALAIAARIQAAAYNADEAMEWAKPIFDRVDSVTDPELRLEILHALGGVAYEAGDLNLASRLAKTVLEEIERIGLVAKWPLAAVHAHMFAVEQGNYVLAQELSDKIHTRESEVSCRYELVACHANEAVMLYEMGQYEEAFQKALKAEQFYAANLSIWVKMGVAAIQGMIALKLGKLANATQLAEQIDDCFKRVGDARAGDMSYAESLVSDILEVHGRREEAERRLQAAIESCRYRDPIARMRLQLHLARLVKTKDRHTARKMAQEVFTRASTCGARPLAERANELLHRL